MKAAAKAEAAGAAAIEAAVLPQRQAQISAAQVHKNEKPKIISRREQAVQIICQPSFQIP
jgi:hypothetical protein